MTSRRRAGIAHIALLLAAPVIQAQALTPSEVFDQVKDSVFVVMSFDNRGKQISQGSAVLLAGGKVATNCHVVRDGVRFVVGRGAREVAGTLFAEDRDRDVCLLDTPGITGKPVQAGRAASLRVGATVYAVGAPQGLDLTLSAGIVSQLRGGPPPMIQTTAAISPGSSGGGLFDSEARLVGLTTLYVEGGQNLNFAMPVEWLNEIQAPKATVSAIRDEGDWLAEYRTLAKAESWSGLLALCRKWVSEQPANGKAWRNLGVSYLHSGRFQEAIPPLQKALQINRRDEAAWYNLGYAYSNLKQYRDSIEPYREALQIDGELFDAWFSLAGAWSELGSVDKAVHAYREALRIEPESIESWMLLGAEYRASKRPTDAIDAYRRAIRLNPRKSAPWNELGLVLYDQRRFEEAIEPLREALRIDPEYVPGWVNLGSCYGRLRRYRDSAEALQAALKIDPEDTVAWFNLGATYHLMGDRAGAMDVVKRLKSLDTKQADRLFEIVVPR